MTTSTVLNQSSLTHRQVLIVFSGLMLGMLLAALDQTIVSTALPTIVGELGGLNHLSWVVTAYLLTSTASVPLFGKISDLYGRKLLFQFAIVIFLVGSMVSGAAPNMLTLVLARGVQGIGGGGLMSMSMIIIGDIVAPGNAGAIRATPVRSSPRRAWLVRSSAASLPTASAGAGFSISTCPWASSRLSSPLRY